QLDHGVNERPDHTEQKVEADGASDRVCSHRAAAESLAKHDDRRESEKQSAEDQVHGGEPGALDEVLHPGHDERGCRERKTGDQHAALSTHGPDRSDQDGGDRDQEDYMRGTLLGKERMGDREKQECDQEQGVAHWFSPASAHETSRNTITRTAISAAVEIR